jgi:hypothetical protein
VTRKLLEVRKRTLVLWAILGIALTQLGLGVLVDQRLVGIRDPEYQHLETLVKDRRAESPGRPLVLAMGTSRTSMGLDAASLSRSHPDGPLVVNAAFNGAGPMMNKVVLGRLLAGGIRPDFVFFEMMPIALSARNGAALEERMTFQGRYSLGEVLGMGPATDEKWRLLYHWGRARLFPCGRHQVELREALGIDQPVAADPRTFGKDAYGWAAFDTVLPPERIEALTNEALDTYSIALKQPTLSKGAVRAYRELFALAAAERIPGAVVCPSESSRFRNCDPAVAEKLMEKVREIAGEFGLPVIDARDWVDDDGFWDGHHLTAPGARRFTERLGREGMPLMPGASPRPVEALPVSRKGP